MQECNDRKCGECSVCRFQAEKDAADKFSKDVADLLLGGNQPKKGRRRK